MDVNGRDFMWWLVCPQENLQEPEKSSSPLIDFLPVTLTLYLVGAGNAQFVEHGEEDLRTEDHHEEVGRWQDAEYGLFRPPTGCPGR